MTVATVLYAGMWPLAFALPRDGEGDPGRVPTWSGWPTLSYLLILIVAGVWAQARWLDRPD